METISILKGAHSRGICAVDFSGKQLIDEMLYTRAVNRNRITGQLTGYLQNSS